jgi:N-acyl-D-amino-acid deacylase
VRFNLRIATIALFCCITCPAAESRADDSSVSARFDIVIRHGMLVDGTGKPAIQADVGIRDGRIVAVGDLADAMAKETIEAKGRVVCPGFIDLHSHADRGLLKYRGAENYIRQGVTTLLCGNCGSSPVDVGEYFRDLRDGGTGPNVAMLIGHSSVRERVLGPLNVPPDEKQLAEMRRLVRQAMQDGAVGMSSGLAYSPGAYATTEELIALAKELKPPGGFYATHMRDEGTQIFEALDEALLIAREAGIPLHVSHHKISSTSVFGLTRLTLERIDKARAAGMDVTLDQYPYGAGSGPLSLYVPQTSLSGGLDAYRKRIADPQQRAEIVAGVEDLLIRKIYEASQRPDNPQHTAAALSRIQIAGAPHDRKLEGKNLTQILQSRQQEITLRNGAELLVELISHDVRGINHTLDDQPGGDVDRVMQHPLTSIASDGGVLEFGSGHPHPRSYGCYPRVLAHYVRERKLLELEQAIHKMTQLPARRLGWTDRGVLRPGAWADVVVFDPQTISDRATFLDPHQHSVGVDHVLVSGQFVLRSGKMTGTLPGKPVGLQPREGEAPAEPRDPESSRSDTSPNSSRASNLLPHDLQRWLVPQDWQRDTDGPIVSLGEPGEFDDTHIFAPAVVREDDRYLLWYCGSRGSVAQRVFRLGLASGRDGRQFEKHATHPVFEFGDGKHSILTPTLLRGADGFALREDGRLRMWFSSTWFEDPSGLHTLHESTSEHGTGWSPPSEPLLSNVYAPTIVKTDDGYQLWHTDVSANPWVIRHATSRDGRKWQVTVDPVLKLDQPWERERLFYPTVLKIDGVYLMWYGSYWSARPNTTALGFAVSTDGIRWHKHPQNPVLRPDPNRPWESHYVTSQSIIRNPDGTFRIWYAGRKQPPFVNKYFAINTAWWQVMTIP